MKNNYLFLGFAIPDEEIQRDFKNDINPSVQTHKFNWNLIRALESSGEINISYISTRPVSDYPLNKKRYYKKNKWSCKLNEEHEVNIHEIGFINTSIGKIISRFFSGLIKCFVEFLKVKNRKGVIVYSVHLPYMVIGLIVSKVFKTDLIGIWTDPPSVYNERDSFTKKSLRNIERIISLKIMSKFNKVISLTDYLATDYCPKAKYLVVEGIINSSDINYNKEYKKNIPLKIVYTGIISKRYGLDNLVNAFKEIDKNNIELDLYGWGDYQVELENISEQNSNINFKGFLPNEEIIKLQRSADFLINTRSTTEKFVKYSFPSKTLEYMTSGTPVISTLLPGIPQEYKNYLITIKDNDKESIKKVLNEISTWNEEKIQLIGEKALNFSTTKSIEKQGERIVNFLTTN